MSGLLTTYESVNKTRDALRKYDVLDLLRSGSVVLIILLLTWTIRAGEFHNCWMRPRGSIDKIGKKSTTGGDHEQSWRAFKSRNQEKLIMHIISREVADMGLRVMNGNTLERNKALSGIPSRVKRNLATNYGVFGLRLPDVDLVIYPPKSGDVISVISSKVTLERESLRQATRNSNSRLTRTPRVSRSSLSHLMRMEF